MSQPFRSALPVSGASEQTGPIILEPFDYGTLDTGIVRQVRKAAKGIRRMVQRTLQDLIVVGNNLLAVKMALPHGSFGPWLRSEFGWTERTARNFMKVAERFGPKTEIISDLRIEPTAAYLLAAPSAPEKATEMAVQRAESGERITVSVAKEILDSFRGKTVRRERASSVENPPRRLRGRLVKMLECFRRQWHPQRFAALARQLRDFADSLEEE